MSDFSRLFNMTDSNRQGLGDIARYVNESGNLVTDPAIQATKNGQKTDGSLASTLVPSGMNGGLIDVANSKKYRWTLSQADLTGEVPYVRLIEYKCNESVLTKQMSFYAHMGLFGDNSEILDVYKGVFPKDNPTDFSYWFPYFSPTAYELSTPEWAQLDSIGSSINSIAGGATTAATAMGKIGAAAKMEIASMAGNAIADIYKLGKQATNAIANVFDRPRVFHGHNSRSITISFPLYNTVSEDDYNNNRSLIYLLMSQNLFNKRDYITGVPPVFYDIWIPGQYYCYAASMTNINVENLGNQRMIYNVIVPDAYYVTLTLTEMVMPSKNQFEAVVNGAASKFVNSATVAMDKLFEEAKNNQVSQAREELTKAVDKPNPQPSPSSKQPDPNASK